MDHDATVDLPAVSPEMVGEWVASVWTEAVAHDCTELAARLLEECVEVAQVARLSHMETSAALFIGYHRTEAFDYHNPEQVVVLSLLDAVGGLARVEEVPWGECAALADRSYGKEPGWMNDELGDALMSMYGFISASNAYLSKSDVSIPLVSRRSTAHLAVFDALMAVCEHMGREADALLARRFRQKRSVTHARLRKKWAAKPRGNNRHSELVAAFSENTNA